MKNVQNLVGLCGENLKGFAEPPSPERCIEVEVIAYNQYIGRKNLRADT